MWAPRSARRLPPRLVQCLPLYASAVFFASLVSPGHPLALLPGVCSSLMWMFLCIFVLSWSVLSPFFAASLPLSTVPSLGTAFFCGSSIWVSVCGLGCAAPDFPKVFAGGACGGCRSGVGIGVWSPSTLLFGSQSIQVSYLPL